MVFYVSADFKIPVSCFELAYHSLGEFSVVFVGNFRYCFLCRGSLFNELPRVVRLPAWVVCFPKGLFVFQIFIGVHIPACIALLLELSKGFPQRAAFRDGVKLYLELFIRVYERTAAYLVVIKNRYCHKKIYPLMELREEKASWFLKSLVDFYDYCN